MTAVRMDLPLDGQYAGRELEELVEWHLSRPVRYRTHEDWRAWNRRPA